MNPPESALRTDLAAAFRWAARLNLHEAVANHFSVAVSDDGQQFLLNPPGRHFSRVRASELLLLDAEHPERNPPAEADMAVRRQPVGHIARCQRHIDRFGTQMQHQRGLVGPAVHTHAEF